MFKLDKRIFLFVFVFVVLLASLVFADVQIDSSTTTSATSVGANENLCIDANGVFHVAYVASGNDVWYGNSTDEGTTWSKKELIATSAIHVSMVCNVTSVYISYVDSVTLDFDGIKSNDNGRTWSNKYTLEDDVSTFAKDASAVMDSNGIIHYCLIDESSDLRYMNSSNVDVAREISSVDSDHCDIEVDSNNIPYIVISDTAGDDIDIMSLSDGWSTRTEIAGGLGSVDADVDEGLALTIDINDTFHIASIHLDDLQYCNGTFGGAWTCGEIDSSTSHNPDIGVTKKDDVFILYASGDGQVGDVLRANSSDWMNWDTRVLVANNTASGVASIAYSRFPLSNNNITDYLHYVYTYNSDVWYANFSVPYSTASPPEDSCTCIDSQAWEIDMSDDCVLSSACSPTDVTFVNTGTFTCNADLTVSTLGDVSNAQNIIIDISCRLII